MKRLVKAYTPPSKVFVSDEAKTDEAKADKNKAVFTPTDLADIIGQLDEVKSNVAIKNDDMGRLLLAVGDSVYEILPIKKNRYPRIALHKLDA